MTCLNRQVFINLQRHTSDDKKTTCNNEMTTSLFFYESQMIISFLMLYVSCVQTAQPLNPYVELNIPQHS